MPQEKQTIKVCVWRQRHLDSGKHFLFFKVWYWSSCFCTHSAPQWSHLGWGKWWPHPWRSGAPPSPEAWRRPSEGRWAFVRGHARLQTTLGEGADAEKIQKWTCRVDTFARLSERLFNDSHEEHFFLSVLTVDDLLPFGLLLAEFAQCFRGCHLPPVRWVRLKLQQAWIHLLQLRGGTGRGGARPFGARNCSLKTEEQKWNPKWMNLMNRAAADALSKCNAEEIVRIHQIMLCLKINQKAFFFFISRSLLE